MLEVIGFITVAIICLILVIYVIIFIYKLHEIVLNYDEMKQDISLVKSRQSSKTVSTNLSRELTRVLGYDIVWYGDIPYLSKGKNIDKKGDKKW